MRQLFVHYYGFFVLAILEIISGFKFNLRECPVYYEEPWDPNMVKFILSMRMGQSTMLYPMSAYQTFLPYGYNVLVPLKIVVHGYGGLSVDSAITNVTAAYQELGYNVIIVDWEPLSSLPCYAAAYLNTWHVGQCLALLTFGLLSIGISPHLIHVVGFSLGAHVAGFAGANVKKMLGYSYRRITGLDPALPLFATLNNEWKLDLSDASFVDIIHTSALTFGKLEATGHVDFYVNGGSSQPFCYGRKSPPLCSHIMAGLYFAESIRYRCTSFTGIKCDSIAYYFLGLCRTGRTAVMGEYTDMKTRGIYYVKTSNKPPFALKTYYI